MPLNFRNTIFWIQDLLKGSKVRKHYNAIKKINDNHGSDFTVRERQVYLSDILRHCPRYRSIL